MRLSESFLCPNYKRFSALLSQSHDHSWDRQKFKIWFDSKQSNDYGFRCGDQEHYAFQCRDPIRYFACGNFGHKKYSCLLFAKFIDSESQISIGLKRNLLKSKSIASRPQFTDHSFQFTLNFLMLKGLLLDNLWK